MALKYRYSFLSLMKTARKYDTMVFISLWAVLCFAVSFLTFLTFSISTYAQALGHTQISGTLPEQATEGTAFIQWGGGSLYQLTARLAVHGCDVSLLWVWDAQEKDYTGYTFSGPRFLNKNFNSKYENNIPPSTIWVQCIDMMNHIYGYGLLTENEKQKADALPRGGHREVRVIDPITESDCEGNNWRPETKKYVLPSIPLTQGVCVILFMQEGLADAPEGRKGFSWHSHNMELYAFENSENQYVYHRFRESIALSRNKMRDYHDLLKVEFHELCHSNQTWHIVKNVFNHDFFIEKYTGNGGTLSYLLHSPAFQEFIDIVGFSQDEKGEWVLPQDSIYRTENSFYGGGIYGYFVPHELAAELCAGYLMRKVGSSGYWTEYFEFYLEDEVVAWLEKYVFVLPESRI